MSTNKYNVFWTGNHRIVEREFKGLRVETHCPTLQVALIGKYPSEVLSLSDVAVNLNSTNP